MEMNKEVINLDEALYAIHAEMPIIGKDKEGFNAKYADLEKVQSIADSIIHKHGVHYNQYPVEEGMKMVVTYKDEVRESIIPWVTKDKPQNRGAEITYYRRYMLVSFFNIVIADEDKDGHIDHEYETSDEELELIEGQLALLNDEEEILKYWKQVKTKDKKVIALFSKRKKDVTK